MKHPIQPPAKTRDSTPTPKICTPRQYRAVVYLTRNNSATCFELQKTAGARNVPELIRSLRKNHWRIVCELFDVTDQDGKTTRPGKYRLETEQIPVARKILSEWKQSHETRGA